MSDLNEFPVADGYEYSELDTEAYEIFKEIASTLEYELFNFQIDKFGYAGEFGDSIYEIACGCLIPHYFIVNRPKEWLISDTVRRLIREISGDR